MSREEVAIFSQPGLTYVKHPGRPLLLSSREIAALCLVAAYPLFTALKCVSARIPILEMASPHAANSVAHGSLSQVRPQLILQR